MVEIGPARRPLDRRPQGGEGALQLAGRAPVVHERDVRPRIPRRDLGGALECRHRRRVVAAQGRQEPLLIEQQPEVRPVKVPSHRRHLGLRRVPHAGFEHAHFEPELMHAGHEGEERRGAGVGRVPGGDIE